VNSGYSSRVVALNIRAGGGKRIPAIRHFLQSHDPDVVVLTEWRDNRGGGVLREWAVSRGMECATLNDGATPNGTFLAARNAFSIESKTPPGARPGVLMQLRAAKWMMLACYFPQREAKAPFFDAALRISIAHQTVPFLLVGDLNTGNQVTDKGAAGAKYSCSCLFDALVGQAGLVDLWRRTNGRETREWTWLSPTGNGFRIDHAFGNDTFIQQTKPSCRYDHTTRMTGVSDHSALIIEADRQGILPP
jgi:exonuclease III